MSRRRLSGLTAVHVLLLVALLEVAINRVAVPMLRPDGGHPPSWHTALDYVGLFLFYFTGTLAALVLGARCWQAIRSSAGVVARATAGLVGLTAALSAAPLFVAAPVALSMTLEVAFAASVVLLVLASFGRRRDLGVQIGLPILAAPLLLHTGAVLGARFVWPDNTFDGPGVAIARAGIVALCLAAITTPYCFAPRPFARAVTRPVPVLLAMAIAGIGALLARTSYPELAKAANLAIGLELTSSRPDPRLAMYLLAVATLVWTLSSCAFSPSAPRRAVGIGLALIVLGGYAFKWPHHYLLPLLGLFTLAEAARVVRDDELAAIPIVSETPPISDTAWATYIAAVAQGLRRVLGDVHSLSTRGDGGLASSLIVGDAGGIPVRARVERIEGSVLALDVVLGRELDDTRAATLTLWAIPPRELGSHPAGPPAAPTLRSGDAPFDERFKIRGSAPALHTLFDDGLRARVAATIDGWIAYWDREALRYRVYPGRGAPLDHPMPLSELALGRAASPDRVVAVIELLVEIAARGVPAAQAGEAAPEPAELA